MLQKKFWLALSGILVVLTMAVTLPTGAVAADSYKILHQFKRLPDGANPSAGLTFDAGGNLYGTTQSGGAATYYGTVFQLKQNANGSWTESVLYSFCSLERCADGAGPEAGLIIDATGSFYGTTTGGGDLQGDGTVFKLTPNTGGSWTETVLYAFAGGGDGRVPFAGVTFDAAGNLYGTTSNGGHEDCSPGSCGTAFRLTPTSDGSWAYNVLHVFHGKPAMDPLGGLVLDQAGSIYGTTNLCSGTACAGGVFEIDP